MIDIHEALSRILSTVQELAAESVALERARGRVLAEDVLATVDVPPWDNSAMDGYAVRAEDTSDDGVDLTILEVIGAGSPPTQVVTPGTTSAIMTGAPMPEGANAVVLVEDSNRALEGTVHLEVGATTGRYVRRRGCDIAKGARVAAAGDVLTPASLGLIASVGRAEVSVRRQPVVAVLTTGDELVRPGRPKALGQIWSTNHITLRGLAEEAGAIVEDHGIARDDPDALREALRGCLTADVVLSTGGVSVGVFDHVKDVMASLGVDMDFWKVRMKPGKPLAFGLATVEGRTVPVFGLPGNPVSSMMGFLQFVRPWLRIALGDRRPHLALVDAIAGEAIPSRSPRARLERVRIALEGGRLVVRSTGNQSSGVLTSMALADGLLYLAPGEDGPEKGDLVRIQVLGTSFSTAAQHGFG